MHITYISEYDCSDPDILSGTPYWIAKSLAREDIEVQPMHITKPLKLLPPLEEFTFRCRQLWAKLYTRTHLVSDLLPRRGRFLAETLKKPLTNLKTDAIFTSLSVSAAAYLETNIPIIYWTDAVFAALANFYPAFRQYDAETMWHGHIATNAALMNAKRVIFSSEWAARTAVEFYGIAKDKIRIVPFGANLDITHTLFDVNNMIKARSKKCIKLLFVGKLWYRKGGDIALAIATALHEAGQAVELTIVGGEPEVKRLPSFVNYQGFISKRTQQGLDKLHRLYQASHFLLLPTRADACPIAFAEANAFGLPCLTTYVGGIPTVVKDNINGMTFSLEAPVQQVCDYIVDVMQDDARYEALALSAFNEYETRLNWRVASSQVKKIIAEVI